MKLFSHPLDKIERYPFAYNRSVQPKINKHRHVVKLVSKELKQSKIEIFDKSSLSRKLIDSAINSQPSIDYQMFSKLDLGYGRGDPLCDAWIEYAISHNLPAHGMHLFNQILDSGDLSLLDNTNKKIPQVLKELFQQTMSQPEWLDNDKVLKACRALSRYPFQQGLVLQSISLMGGYCVPALAEPLLATGQLTDNVVSRIARTLCFLASVTIPQGLTYNHDLLQWEVGFKQTLKTRVIHSLVRYKLQNGGYNTQWNQQKYGIPINQTDMIATNMSFSLTVIHGLTKLECDLSTDERQAILHLWRYVGHIIGIDDNLIPKTEADCNEWFYSYISTQAFEPKPASCLAGALHKLPILIETSEFKGLAKLEQNLRAGITRSYWGDDICDDLGLPRQKLSGIGMFGLSKMQMVMEQLQKSSNLTQQLMIRSSTHYRNKIKTKYLASNPHLEPLFDEIYELAMRAKWQ